MIPLLALTVLAAGGLYLYANGSRKGSVDEATPLAASGIEDMPDVDPDSQGGSWSREFDDAFKNASVSYGVPFALLKAHAIRESALKSSAFRLEPSGKASYGLMQILWWAGSNRFAKYGFNDDYIGDGSNLYDPYVNCGIAAQLIKDNLQTFVTLRDAVNAYNTGKSESEHKAPGNYVNDVIKYYSTLVGRKVD